MLYNSSRALCFWALKFSGANSLVWPFLLVRGSILPSHLSSSSILSVLSAVTLSSCWSEYLLSSFTWEWKKILKIYQSISTRIWIHLVYIYVMQVLNVNLRNYGKHNKTKIFLYFLQHCFSCFIFRKINFLSLQV